MSTAAGPRQRSRRGEGDRLREEILDAAERLLVEKGNPDAVSVRGIAKAVGCTPPALYLHFDDKEELFFHVCHRRYEEFDARLKASGEGAVDVADELLRMGRAYVAYGLEHPEAYAVLFGIDADLVPEGVPEEDLPGMQAFHRLVDVIRRGGDEGVLGVSDPVAAAIGVWATMHGLTSMLLRGASEHLPMPEDIVEVVCHQVLDGLRAH